MKGENNGKGCEFKKSMKDIGEKLAWRSNRLWITTCDLGMIHDLPWTIQTFLTKNILFLFTILFLPSSQFKLLVTNRRENLWIMFTKEKTCNCPLIKLYDLPNFFWLQEIDSGRNESDWETWMISYLASSCTRITHELNRKGKIHGVGDIDDAWRWSVSCINFPLEQQIAPHIDPHEIWFTIDVNCV